jgi:hypothetical protein
MPGMLCGEGKALEEVRKKPGQDKLFSKRNQLTEFPESVKLN